MEVLLLQVDVSIYKYPYKLRSVDRRYVLEIIVLQFYDPQSWHTSESPFFDIEDEIILQIQFLQDPQVLLKRLIESVDCYRLCRELLSKSLITLGNC